MQSSQAAYGGSAAKRRGLKMQSIFNYTDYITILQQNMILVKQNFYKLEYSASLC